MSFIVLEDSLECDDYDSTFPSSRDPLTLVVRFEMLEAPAGEVVFGDLSFGHLVAEPWAPNELSAWKDRWKQLILDVFDDAFVLEVYEGTITSLSRFELSVGHQRVEDPTTGGSEDRVGASAAYRTQSSGQSSFNAARAREGREVPCRLRLDEASGPDARAHLRIRVAKGRTTDSSSTPQRGVEAAGGSSQDIDMLLVSGDLDEVETRENITQRRALLEFGKYLGCFALPAGTRDLMSSGEDLHPWHGWPWWHRFVDHVDGGGSSDYDRGMTTTNYPLCVVVRVKSTGERSRRTAPSNDTQNSDGGEQGLLRDGSPDVTVGEVMEVVLIALGIGFAALVVIGMAAGVGIWVAEGGPDRI
jgi:hypothetical protein